MITKEPKRWKCTCGHKFKTPKLEQAVLSDLTTIKAYVCPKCFGIKTFKETDEWRKWTEQQKPEHLKKAIDSAL